MTEQSPAPQVVYQQGEPYNPNRKYLNASSWFYLALKVFGYNVLGYLIIVIPIFAIIAILSGIGGGL